MRLGNINIATNKTIESIVNLAVKKAVKNIEYTNPDYEENYREAMTGRMYKEAIESLESILYPWRFEYMNMCESALLDSTVQIASQIRFALLKNRRFYFVDEKDKEIESLNDVVKSYWFNQLLITCTKSIMCGHELAELKSIINGIPEFDEYKDWLLISPYRKCLQSSINADLNTAVDYTKEPFNNSYIEFRYNKLGKGVLTSILLDVAYKSVGTWAAEAKAFSNVRVLETNAEGTALKNAINKVSTSKDWIVISSAEKFTIESAKTDSSENHKSVNGYLDNKIISVILGSDLTNEKSFVGAIQIQKDILDTIVNEDATYYTYCINKTNVLKVHGLIPENAKLKFETNNKFNEDNTVKIITEVIKAYNVQDDDIEKVTGMKVEGRLEKQQNINGNDKGRSIQPDSK